MKINNNKLISIFENNTLPNNFIFQTTDIETDSRLLKKNKIFFAISGANFDGNNFITDAVLKGAKCIICKSGTPVNGPALYYSNDKKALYDLAQLVLDQTTATRIAITGSNGKTTTKEILSHILSKKHSVLKTYKNFNNNIGLPLSIFKADLNHSALVMELGMNAKGEISSLSQLFKPDYSIITNAGRAHLEFLKTTQAVAKAKCELIPNTKKALVYNCDSIELNQHILNIKDSYSIDFISYSTKHESDVFANKISLSDNYTTHCTIIDKINNESFDLSLPLPGMHNISNFLGAYTCARLMGLSTNDIITAASSLSTYEGRLKVIERDNVIFIDDSYNANPDSMEVGLESIAQSTAKRTILVLGDMKELGTEEVQLHKKLGQFIAKKSFDILLTYGNLAKNISEAASKNGMKNTIHFNDYNLLKEHIINLITDNDLVFIKASNSLKLYKLIEDITKE